MQLGCHPVAVHIYTQAIHRTTQITTNVEECGPCHVFASFTLAFALQLRKRHGKTSVRVRKTSVRVHYTYYQNTHTFRFKRAKVTGVCKKLRQKSITFCTLQYYRVSNSRRVRGTEKKGCIVDVRNAENQKEKEILRDLRLYGGIILK
jgi:hypothetical protein